MKRFRLDIVGKLEDRPRLLRAYGRVKGGEVALALRPLESAGMLLRLGKHEAVRWRPEGAPPVAWPRAHARARVTAVGTRAIVIDGPLAQKGFRLKDARVEDGEVLSVAIDLAHKTATALPVDAPQRPTAPVEAGPAIRAIKDLQKRLGRGGPVTFRGQWAGVLVYDEDAPPRVELRRKLASYGWLRIHSGPEGWAWSFERLQKWFSEPQTHTGVSRATLVEAIDGGVRGALGQVQTACRVRDTTRRQALDAAWAATHPLPTPRQTRNPMERLQDAPPSTSSEPEAARAQQKATSSAKGGRKPAHRTTRSGATRPPRTGTPHTQNDAETGPTIPKPRPRTKPARRKKAASKATPTPARTGAASKANATSKTQGTRTGTAPPANAKVPTKSKAKATSTRKTRTAAARTKSPKGTKARSTTAPAPSPDNPRPEPCPLEDAALMAAFADALAATLDNRSTP